MICANCEKPIGDRKAYTTREGNVFHPGCDDPAWELRQELSAATARVAKLEAALRTGRDAIGVMVEVIVKCFLEASDNDTDKEAATKVLARIQAAKPIMDAELPCPKCKHIGEHGAECQWL